MPRIAFLLAALLLVLAACSLSPDSTTAPEATDEPCGNLAFDNRIACIEVAPTSFLAQSPADGEITVDLSGVSVSLRGTIYVTLIENYTLSVATIEGVSVIGASGATRVVQPGAQVVVMIADGRAAGAPTVPFPFDVPTIRQSPLGQLPRPVSIPRPIAAPPGFTPPPTVTPTFTPTATPTATTPAATTLTEVPTTPTPEQQTPSATETPTITSAACVVREEWTGLYTIQRGDTLARIAARFGVSVGELQLANCITDPDRIFAGQVLRLPPEAFLNLSTPTRTPAPINFRADQTTLQAGQCTTLRWDVDAVSAVYFDDELTTEHNARQVCPAATTDYTLLVIEPDGAQRTRTITITAQP